MSANDTALWVLFILIVGLGLHIFIRRQILRSKRERENREWLVIKRLLETESEDREIAHGAEKCRQEDQIKKSS